MASVGYALQASDAAVDDRFVNVAGDMMIGPLQILGPNAKLTVGGMIETTLGGYKFPDDTIQTTAGFASVMHDATLMGMERAAYR